MGKDGYLQSEKLSAVIWYDESDEPFVKLLEWFFEERRLHQQGKFDYGEHDEAHALEGLGDGSWFWDKGVLNYAQRVRLFGVTEPLGYQALLKLAATMIAQAEHLLRAGHVTLPQPGLSSGNL